MAVRILKLVMRKLNVITKRMATMPGWDKLRWFLRCWRYKIVGNILNYYSAADIVYKFTWHANMKCNMLQEPSKQTQTPL